MPEPTVDGSSEAALPDRYGGSRDVGGRDILEFASGHPLVLVTQVARLFELERAAAGDVLERLGARGLLRCGPRLRHQVASHQITAPGLREIASDLPVPVVDLRRYPRDIAVAWLSVSARLGVFGEVDRVYTRREMMAVDQQKAPVSVSDEALSPDVRAKAADRLFGLRLAQDGGGQDGALYYPDLVLVLPQGRVAMEVQIEALDSARLDRLLRAYAEKASVRMVVFFAEDPPVRAQLEEARVRGGLAGRMRVEAATLSR